MVVNVSPLLFHGKRDPLPGKSRRHALHGQICPEQYSTGLPIYPIFQALYQITHLFRSLTEFPDFYPIFLPVSGVSLMIPCLPSMRLARLQILMKTVFILIYHRQGCLHDIRMAAIIRPKKDLLCTKFLYKLSHAGWSGSAESVNGLIIIPHCKNISMFFRQNFHDTVLSVIDILKFIDQYIFKPVLPVCTLPRITLQKLLTFL